MKCVKVKSTYRPKEANTIAEPDALLSERCLVEVNMAIPRPLNIFIDCVKKFVFESVEVKPFFIRTYSI